MVRGKKKEELTLEEKLEQALVPMEEQPYEVPENWCFFRFTSLIDIEGGTQPPKSQFVEEPMDGYVRLVQIRDFASDKYVVYVPDTKKLRKFNKDDVMIARYGASIGRICTGLEGAYNVALAKTIFSREVLNRDYVYWMLQSETFQYPLRTISRSAQAGFNKKDLSNFLLPLPPLAEQQRIVDRIESLFAKLDEAKEKVQFVRNCCDDNFSSVVHEALTGNLTEEWRVQNGLSRDGWKKSKLGNLGSLERGRSKHRPRNDSRLFGGSYPFIQTGDVAEADVYIEKHKQTLSEFGLAQSRMFSKGTLCITIAANIGDVAILSYDCCFPDSVVGFTPCKDVESKYIYYMMSELQKEIEANAPATAQKNINLKILNDIDIIIPSVIEQREIIAILDDLYDKKRQVKEKTEQIVDAIDMMKKSILTKAFRGELGTNNPEEESAIKLLKKILVET